MEDLRQDASDENIEEFHIETGIDRWFLNKIRRIVRMEAELREARPPPSAGPAAPGEAAWGSPTADRPGTRDR